MNDNQKAAAILRQYAGELYQGHTIGGEWDGEHIKAEHDEMMALAARRAALAQSGEAVAYLYHDALSVEQIDPRAHSVMFALAADRLPGYRNETPLYARPDSGRVAELEAAIAAYLSAVDESEHVGASDQTRYVLHKYVLHKKVINARIAMRKALAAEQEKNDE